MATKKTESDEKPKASLSWSLYVECPNCEEDFDLAEMDEEGFFSTPIFNNQWDDLKDEDVTCPNCEHEMQLGEVEY